MISFIVPAFNEERLLGPTLQAIRGAASVLAEPYEILVVDDSSTDATAAIAAQHGAAVLSVAHRQIAAVRDAGARHAQGEILVFVDADTLINAAAVRAAVHALRNGAVGGSAIGIFDGSVPLFARILVGLWIRLVRLANLTMGCFLFCTRDAYEAVGGFDLHMFAFEDVALGRALSRVGKIVVLRETVSTSGRNLRAHSTADAFRMLGGLLRHGRGFLGSRRHLDYWYGARDRTKAAEHR